MTERERMCAAKVGCPACGARPALRLSEWLVERIEGDEPSRRVASYRCQRRGCGVIYDILAGSLQG
jgi:hypothetical protein